MKLTYTRSAAAAACGFALLACSHATPPSAAHNSAAAPATSTGSTEPETAAGARTAAQQYFALYSASQFNASYALLAPSAQAAVSRATWVAVHEGCPSQSAGLAYDIKNVTMAGNTAVVTVTLAGAASGLASASEAFTYTGGRWGYAPGDLSLYRHGSVRADIAAAKAAGYCAGS